MRPGMIRCLTTPGLILLFLFSGHLFFSPPAQSNTEKNSLRSVEKRLKDNLPVSSKALVGIDFGESGFGSGVIVDKDGLVLSAAHVTGGVNRPCTIILHDGTRVRGITLGLNANTDAGAIRIITPGTYDFIPLAKNIPQEGDWVYALGHSGGYDPDRGYVARLGKVIHAREDSIRTDCKLIGGDSGGPLFNLEGQLIGIHSRVGMVLENNIHVPIPDFNKDWQALLNGEWVQDGPFTQKKPGKLNVIVTESPEGLLLTDIASYEKDLKENDLLTQWNDEKLTNKKELEKLLASSYAGQKVTLTVNRYGSPLRIEFILRTPPDKDASTPPVRIPDYFTLPESKNKKGDEE